SILTFISCSSNLFWAGATEVLAIIRATMASTFMFFKFSMFITFMVCNGFYYCIFSFKRRVVSPFQGFVFIVHPYLQSCHPLGIAFLIHWCIFSFLLLSQQVPCGITDGGCF